MSEVASLPAPHIRGNALRYAEAARREDLVALLRGKYNPDREPTLAALDQILTAADHAVTSGRPWRLFSQNILSGDPESSENIARLEAAEQFAKDIFLLLGADLSAIPDPVATTEGEVTTLEQAVEVPPGTVLYTQTESPVGDELQISHNALFTPNTVPGPESTTS
ncbi:MAG TPA: hypothetical protein VKQ34_03490 [Candidatus Saccharimonadales bacterium]|nr:hypothetical protein [Candidatus Saccharimonadales bacterium]